MRSPVPIVYILNFLYNQYNNIQNIYSKSNNKNHRYPVYLTPYVYTHNKK